MIIKRSLALGTIFYQLVTVNRHVCEECRMLDWAAAAAASARWGQTSPAGGALLPGWDPARLPTQSLRSALDFLVRDHGHFLLPFGRENTRSDVIRKDLPSWEKGEPFVSSLAPVLVGNLGAEENLSSSWNASVSGNGSVTARLNDGSPLTVGFRSEMEHGVGGLGTLLFVCVKLFTLFYVYERGYIGFYYFKLCAYLYSPRPT